MSKKISLFQLLLPISSDWDTIVFSVGVDISILKAKNHTKIIPSIQKMICQTQIDGIPNDQLSTLPGLPNISFPIIKPGPKAKNIQATVTIQALGFKLRRVNEKFL